jgi:hypothetical protein
MLERTCRYVNELMIAMVQRQKALTVLVAVLAAVLSASEAAAQQQLNNVRLFSDGDCGVTSPTGLLVQIVSVPSQYNSIDEVIDFGGGITQNQDVLVFYTTDASNTVIGRTVQGFPTGTGLANDLFISIQQPPTVTGNFTVRVADETDRTPDRALGSSFSGGLLTNTFNGAALDADCVPQTNTSPTAEAGTAQAVTSGTQVTLAGSGTDTDGTIASYAWTRTGGSGVAGNATLSSATAQSPTFTDSSLTLDTDQSVTHIFELVVTDDDGTASVADSVTITINAPDDTTAPATPTATITVNPDNTVTVSGSAEPDATVEVTFPDESVQTVVATGGTYTITSAAEQPSGDVSIVAIDAANNRSEALTVSFVAAASVAKVQEEIATFMQNRGSNLIAAQPDLIGLLSGAATGAFNVDATQNNGTFNIATSAGSPVWARLQGTWSESGDNENSYFFGAAGAHYAINPDFVIGALVEFDRSTQENGTAETQGTGYLVGPYFVAKLPEQPLFIEGRYLVGQTDNDVSVDGAADQSFETDRTLASVKMAGQLEYGDLTLTPSLSATRLEDTQKAFIDNAGRDVDEQGVTVQDITLGLDFSMPFEMEEGTMTLTGGFAAISSSTEGTGFARTIVPSFEGERARIHLGTSYAMENGMVLSAGANYDGLGSDDYQSFGAQLGLQMKF